MAEDYVNFESALKELKLTEDQLKRLVSEGEIRAIRGENNSMKFRREEIERLKQDTGKTIQYTEESSDTLTDDLLFDEASDLEVDEEGMATAQISSEDTFVGDDVGMTTAPIKGQKAPPPPPRGKTPSPRRTPSSRAAKATAAGTAKRTTTGSGAARGATQTVRRTTGRSTRMSKVGPAADVVASGLGMGMVSLLVISFIVSAYSLLVWWDIARNHLSGPTEGLAKWAAKTFAG